MRAAAVRISALSILLGGAGMAFDAVPLMWLSLTLGIVGLCALVAALRGHA